LGGAMMTPVGRLIMFRSFPKSDLVRAMTYVTIPALVGPAVGPIVGGAFATYLSWRYIFFINLPIGVLSIIFAWRHVENFREDRSTSFDFLGFFLCAIGLALLQFSVEYGGRHLISPWVAIVLACAGSVGLCLYARHARTAPNPVIDLALFRVRTFSISVLAGGLSRLAQGALPFLIPLALQLGLGFSPLRSGINAFLMGVGAIGLKGVSAPILRWLGFRKILVGNSVVQAGLVAGMALLSPTEPGWLIAAYLFIFGFFRSLHFTSVNVLAFADLEPHAISRATSVSSVALQLSMSLGVTYAAALLALFSGSEAHVPLGAFRWAFLVVALTALLPVPFFLRLRANDGEMVSGHHIARAETGGGVP
jgi:predicted MFS family arabinose efflux permease